jgi:hypothetical protein
VFDNYGQLGIGSTVEFSVPREVKIPGKARLISSGQAGTCAATEDDKLYCWGLNPGNIDAKSEIYPPGLSELKQTYVPLEVHGL